MKTRNPDKSDRKKDVRKESDFSKISESVAQRSDVTSKKVNAKTIASKSEVTEFKYSDLYDDSDDEDETNRLIQLRNADYMDVVQDDFKLVVALTEYPKSKMRLLQMALFQKCLHDILDMQLSAGLLKHMPCFIDYYLHRGALVCICKDLETRDWMVRILPGLEERMSMNLVLLKTRVKRLCLAGMKIPQRLWPPTAQDAFKLLQYFNPSLKTHLWKIYAQKVVDNVELTSFLIDRVSGEIIRGPSFKNVLDYDQIEFELTGYTEVYYEYLLSSMEEDLHSVSSRVKLLAEIKSEETTPNMLSEISIKKRKKVKPVPNVPHFTNKFEKLMNETEMKTKITNEINQQNIESLDNKDSSFMESNVKEIKADAIIGEQRNNQKEILSKLKDIEYVGPRNDILVWSDEPSNYVGLEIIKPIKVNKNGHELDEKNSDMASMAITTESERFDSSADNIYHLLFRSSNLNIDSRRDIDYHRRTYYSDVENKLKVAIILEGYPMNKLGHTHMKELKHLCKEYIHKDIKNKRFLNLIMPKFQDVYLCNGAVIYICDSLETKDYLIKLLPKYIFSTGLKLKFTEVTDLIRYTKVVMRLPKEKAHIESKALLLSLKSKYPNLNPDCWKYYSDVAGKQKREFGVDSKSVEVIKSPEFDPIFEGEKIVFEVIERQIFDVSLNVVKTDVEFDLEVKENLIKKMYAPINLDVISNSLARIRANHYSDLISDDLKLYIGPSSFPETKIDEALFHQIKITFENIALDSYQKGELNDTTVPTLHDLYLFDGVIFVICQNITSRIWIENVMSIANARLNTQLKATEFRGAVGIVSMVVQTPRSIDDVIDILQQNNPRLRTKYWRKISTVTSNTKIDAVLQIDKLSAEVIIEPTFNKHVDTTDVNFTLGHMKSLIKPKMRLEQLTKKYNKRMEAKFARSKRASVKKPESVEGNDRTETTQTDNKNEDNVLEASTSIPKEHINLLNITEEDSKLLEDYTNAQNNNKDMVDSVVNEPDDSGSDKDLVVPENNPNYAKVIVKLPESVLPVNEDELNIILELLENKNPGLNTATWVVYTDADYKTNGKVTMFVDKQSLSVIRDKGFDGTIGGEKLKYFF